MPATREETGNASAAPPMTSPQRVRRALNWESFDRVPFENGGFSDGFLAAWARAKGVPRATQRDLDEYYGSDVAELRPDHSPWPARARVLEQTDAGTVRVDGFGQTRRETRGGSFWEPLACALERKSDLDGLEFDPPSLESRYAPWLENLEQLKSRYWVRVKVGGPYSRSKWMRGEERYLVDLVDDPAFAGNLAARVAEHVTAVGLGMLGLAGLQDPVVHVHDDMASLRGLFFSPRTFESVFLEPYSRMCAAFHAAGARVVYGGEGNVSELLDLLLAAGVDGFMHLELRAGMDVVELRRRYGRRVLLFGNICNTVTLPGGDRRRIRTETLRQVEMARDGGCVVGPSHAIGPDVSVESYECMVEAVRETGSAA